MVETAQQQPTADTLRRRAWIRLGIAGGITVLALAGLWWLDKSKTPPAREPPTAPAPIVTPAPTPAPPAPLAPEPEPTAAETAPEAPAAPSLPPPPPRVKSPSPPQPRSERPAPVPKTAPARVTAPPAQPPAPPGPPQGERVYVLQLGVFSNPDNAQQLIERLHREGIRAYSETRVQVGPFRTRAEAEQARAALQRLGLSAVITPQAATR